MKQFLLAVTAMFLLSSATYSQSRWWVSSDSMNIFTRNTGGVMIGGVEPLGKLTVNGDRLGFNLALVGDYNNLTKNYLKIGVLGRASNGLDGHTLFDLYHSNGSQKKAGFNFRINEKSAFFINGEGNIGIGTEKPSAGLDITSGPDWGGFRRGLRLSANNAISVESGEMKYGMVGSENALHFFATNGGEKVNPFGSAFARLMSLQPKKVVIEGDLEVKGKIISSQNFNNNLNLNNSADNNTSSTVKSENIKIGERCDGDLWVSVNNGECIIANNSNVFQKVGINTEAPQYDLDVNGTINATELKINGNSIVNSVSQWNTSGNDIYYNNTGNVGIGTTSPGAKLEING